MQSYLRTMKADKLKAKLLNGIVTNWSFADAGLSAQTLHSKIRRGGGLTPAEAAAIHNALAGVGLSVAK